MDAKTHGDFITVRPDPRTGSDTPGVFLWTPLHDGIDPEDIYIPDATEFIPVVTSSAAREDKTPHVIAPIDDPHEGPAAPLSDVCRYYSHICACGLKYTNNCAHYLSNAFIQAGYTDLLYFNQITARCAAGRPIRAFDVLSWFKTKRTESRTGLVPRGNGYWATYQETPGWKHVAVIDTDSWKYCGTGDYSRWPIQWSYRW